MPTGHCFYAAFTVSATAHPRFARCRRANLFDSRRSPLNVEDAEQMLGIFNRAGDGNRTRLYSLGSCRSTDELRPQGVKTLSQYLTHAVSAKIAGGGSHVISEIYAGNGTPCSLFISSALLLDGSFFVWCFTD